MQPLISPVDHETRRSSIHREEGSQVRPSEDTPLINRFPDNHLRQRNLVTIITVGFLVTILLAGVIIGIYLLILQSNSENILPPVEDDKVLFLTQWTNEPLTNLEALQAKYVVVMQTDTRQCLAADDCMTLLKEMKVSNGNKTLPYNFLISSDGLTFEALGWNRTNLYSGIPSLVIAFIGNFTDVAPPRLQLDAFNYLLTTSVTRHFLSSNYSITVKNSKFNPEKLFETISHLPEWKQL